MREDNYYRDIAVYVQMAETFERSIVFTHAEISINEETYIKSDFVTMTVRINQKRDKFAGVMFGDNIDDTYRKAWQKVLNPPRLNIYVPVKANDNKEFSLSDTEFKGESITKILFKTSRYDENNKCIQTINNITKTILSKKQLERLDTTERQKKINEEKNMIQQYLNEGYRYYPNEQKSNPGYITYEKKLIQIKRDTGTILTFAASGYINEDNRSCTMMADKLLEAIGCKDKIKIPVSEAKDHKGRPYVINNHIKLSDMLNSLKELKNLPITLEKIDYDDKTRTASIVFNANVYGKKIDSKKVIFSPVITNPKRYFFYSDGPETIKRDTHEKVLLKYYTNTETKEEGVLEGGRGENEGLVDFEFYHKCYVYKENKEKNKLYLCIVIKNISNQKTEIIPYESEYFSMETTAEPEDEEDKERYCAEVEKNFFNSKQKETVTLSEGEEYVYKFEFDSKDKKAGRGKKVGNEMIRIYGRTRIKCLDNKTIKARVIVLQKKDFNSHEGNLWRFSDNMDDKIEEKRDSGQFSGVLNYVELNVTVKGMKKGEYFMLGDYAQGGSPREIEGRLTKLGKPDNREYPTPLYADPRENYKYFFGNFGIIYNITFEGKESNTLKMYPFGHNFATVATILIKEGNKEWNKIQPLYNPNNEFKGTKELYSQFTKDDNIKKMALIGYVNTQLFPQVYKEININNNKFSYMLSGGNCGGIKFLME